MGELDYLEVLTGLEQLPFRVGKKLLACFLRGEKSESVEKNKLDKLTSYGALGGYSGKEVEELINQLMLNGFITQAGLTSNKFLKVCQITELGKEELKSPSFYKKKVNGKCLYKTEALTEQDKKLFAAFDFFLNKYNDWQKKAMTSASKKILCVAGAGSGKTTTLTKRIEFLIKYRSVKPEKIIAITFTRKAKQEMESRLAKNGITGVMVETFNSFCEKTLNKHEAIVYGKQMKVVSFSDKIRLIQQALENIGINIERAINMYYSPAQKRGKEDEELMFGFMNDCYTIIEYYKSEGKAIADLSGNVAKMVSSICGCITNAMQKEGLRDYTDQIAHALNLFKEHSELIPRFEHILVDEYQDINAMQMELIKLLNGDNLFCVGDPRQSIFGWRGSKISYILDAEGFEVIPLVINYRSGGKIVKLINYAIKSMKVPDLENFAKHDGDLYLNECDNEAQEYSFVTRKIAGLSVPLDEIFILSRTNRQLEEMSEQLKIKGIKHVIRSEDVHEHLKEGHVTLATIHAIKGMEADTVFVIGCNNFPCRASDHPIVDLIKKVDYDKDEEERRLFYVALSRAKNNLYLTYTGNLTRFFTDEMKRLVNEEKLENADTPIKKDAFDRLKDWRRKIAKQNDVPAYIIFHDDVLLQIAIRRPTTLDELAEIKGIGPVKLQKYGEEILGLI